MPLTVVQKAKPIGVAEDVVRSSGTGLVEGGAFSFGTFGDLRDLGEIGTNWVASKLGAKGPLPSYRNAPTNLVMDAPRIFANAVLQRAGMDPRKARLITTFAGPGGLAQAPNSREMLGAVTRDRPLYQPQTKAGQYARTTAQFAAGAAPPGTTAQRVARVLVPGIASEGAGQLTEGTAFEPWARMAAAILGGGAVELGLRPPPHTQILADRSRGASDASIAAARRLMEDAQARGVRLTMAEALQQVTNGGTGMGRMQRVVEATEGGGAKIAPVMAQRPRQVAAAVRQEASTIAPPTPRPSTIGPKAQEQAATALSGVRRAINDQAAPAYKAMEFQLLGDPIMAPLHQNPAYLETARAVRADRVLGPALEGLEDGSPAFVNEVVKRLDELAANARPNPAQPGGNNQLAAAYDAAAAQAREVMSRHVPEWNQARGIVAQGRATALDPLQQGPLGVLAATDDTAAQMRALYPTAPLEGAPAETTTAIQMMGGPASTPARDLTRQQIMTGFNEAAQDLSAGPNQWGGAMWAARQFGNPEQRATMLAGVDAVGGDAGSMERLIEVLRATGRRQAPGSQTAYNTRDLERLGEAGALGEGLRTGLNPPGVFRRMGQAFQNWQTESNAGALAEAILASPADAEQILLHARRVVPAGAELQAIERLALAAQIARQGGEQ